jgi:hypothetical protein
MWFKGETDKDFQFSVGNKIVFSKEKETVTIKGEESELIIGKVAMLDGYVVTKMQIVYSSDNPRYTFTMKGSDLSFNSLKMPKVEGDGSDNEEEGMILEKVYLIEEITLAIDKIFSEFILLRVNSIGWSDTVQKIKDWINEG